MNPNRKENATSSNSIIIRRKDVLAILGCTLYMFQKLIDLGRIRPRHIKDAKGRNVGLPLYVRAEIVKLRAELQEQCEMESNIQA